MNAASSMRTSAGAEKPRRVRLLSPGKVTTREPFESINDNFVSSSVVSGGSRHCRKLIVLMNSSRLCLCEGAIILVGVLHHRGRRAAVERDRPHLRMAADQQVEDIERLGAALGGLPHQLLEGLEPTRADDPLVTV